MELTFRVLISCIVAITLLASSGVAADAPETDSTECGKNDGLACHGAQMLKRVVRQIIEAQDSDVQLADGVHLVEAQNKVGSGRSADDGSVSGAVENYFLNHELRINLPELMPKDGIKSTLKKVIDEFSDRTIAESARGKKNKGGGIILLMGLMMGKVLAAVGLGSIGLLAMKALMVSALALMLSAIIGIKKLASSGHDDGGHQVIYAGHGHGHDYHRRKREAELDEILPLPYRGWAEYFTQE